MSSKKIRTGLKWCLKDFYALPNTCATADTTFKIDQNWFNKHSVLKPHFIVQKVQINFEAIFFADSL